MAPVGTTAASHRTSAASLKDIPTRGVTFPPMQDRPGSTTGGSGVLALNATPNCLTLTCTARRRPTPLPTPWIRTILSLRIAMPQRTDSRRGRMLSSRWLSALWHGARIAHLFRWAILQDHLEGFQDCGSHFSMGGLEGDSWGWSGSGGLIY